MMKQFFYFLTATLFMTMPASAAEPLRFSSGPAQTVLVELFTSEGCSSCPPAEVYLNRFTGHTALWKQYIPLAFHVDYWDYLGWKDRYAQPAHAQRQQQYAQQRRVSTVYTPAFVVNGQGWRPGWTSEEPKSEGTPAGTLTVSLRGTQLEAVFDPLTPETKTLQLHLAILGMGLTTEIRAGENSGRQAQHEFVVLAQKQINTNNGRWRGTLPEVENRWGAKRLALVTWVSRADDLAPLQATGGYLP